MSSLSTSSSEFNNFSDNVHIQISVASLGIRIIHSENVIEDVIHNSYNVARD